MKSSEKKLRGLRCLAAAFALPAVAVAQTATERELIWALEAGAERTDNVRRAAVNEESQTIATAALTFALNLDRPRLDTNIGAHLEYQDYLDDAFDDELVGGVNGLVSYAFIPERFIWVAEDNFGQIASDREQVDTPDNRQNVNFFSTGPDITFDITGRTALQLSGRFSDAYYEVTPEDNQSVTGSLALIRHMSDISNLSLNGSTSEITYEEDELFGDYRLNQGFLRWETATERTIFIADAGYTVIDRDGESSDGMLARIEFSRAVASRSRIGFNAGTEFATAGDAFRRDQTITGIATGNDDAIAGGDPYQLDYAYLTWNTEWERSELSAVLSARGESHEVDTDADRDAYAASIGVSRQISRRLDATLTGGYNEEKFVNTNFSFDEWTVGLGLSWFVSERMSLNVRLDHIEGSSDDGTRDFDENRAYIGFAYSRRGS